VYRIVEKMGVGTFMLAPCTVSDYYHSLESRIGYRLILGGTRHFGYYGEGTLWPFPIEDALRRMEEHLYRTLNLRNGSLVLDAGTGNGDVAIFMARKGLKVKAMTSYLCTLAGPGRMSSASI